MKTLHEFCHLGWIAQSYHVKKRQCFHVLTANTSFHYITVIWGQSGERQHHNQILHFRGVVLTKTKRLIMAKSSRGAFQSMVRMDDTAPEYSLNLKPPADFISQP